MSKKIQWCDRAIFISPIFYTIATSYEIFEKIRKRMGCPPPDVNTGGDATTFLLEHSNGNKACVVYFPHKKKDLIYQALIVHEAVHIWQHIREDIGEVKPSAEFEAYAIQIISQRLLEEYHRQVKR